VTVIAREARSTLDRWAVTAVFAVGIVVRFALLRSGPGQDFVVWDKATEATLRGANIYAHHPGYPGGPFAYLPLFLYVELPFRWLALETHSNFTVWGKVPILAGDLLTAWLIADEVARRGGSRRAQAVGAAAFLLNPLVLYNGAWYGRFDSLACALLLGALRAFRRHGAGVSGGVGWYALAVAAKTFPGFAVAGVLRAARGHRTRAVLLLAGIIALLSLPYLDTLHAYTRDIVFYDAGKTPQALSWQTLLLPVLSADHVRLLGYVLLAVFAVATVLLSRIADLDRYVLVIIVLFLCCSKVVLDQYLTWPLPWLAIMAVTARGRPAASSAALFGVLTTIGMLANATIDPFGRSPAVVDILLAVACAAYVAAIVHDSPRREAIVAAPT
jgi:hypothetical protein